MKLPRYVLVLFVALFLISAVILYFFSPQDYSFYPRCPFFRWTGFKCPFCGGLRAAHELVHGSVLEAIRYNGFLVIAFPLFLLIWLYDFRKIKTKSKEVKSNSKGGRTAFLLVAILIWWVVRNLFGF